MTKFLKRERITEPSYFSTYFSLKKCIVDVSFLDTPVNSYNFNKHYMWCFEYIQAIFNCYALLSKVTSGARLRNAGIRWHVGRPRPIDTV